MQAGHSTQSEMSLEIAPGHWPQKEDEMDEKIKEIGVCISKIILDDKGMLINTEAWIEDYKLLKNAKPWIEFLLSKVKELEELEKGLRNAIECDGQTIKRWEELFEHSQSKVKELEKAGFNLMDYTKKLGHDLEVAHALRDAMRMKANIAEAKVKELEEEIQIIIDSEYMNSLVIKEKLKKLVEKEIK